MAERPAAVAESAAARAVEQPVGVAARTAAVSPLQAGQLALEAGPAVALQVEE